MLLDVFAGTKNKRSLQPSLNIRELNEAQGKKMVYRKSNEKLKHAGKM